MTTSIQKAGAIPEFELNHRVKLAREFAGLSQDELADKTGLSRGGIAKIEKGESSTRRSSITLIAFATGVDREWLEKGITPVEDNPDGGGECAIRVSNPGPTDQGFKVLDLHTRVSA